MIFVRMRVFFFLGGSDVNVGIKFKVELWSCKVDFLEYWDEDEFEGLFMEEEVESGFVVVFVEIIVGIVNGKEKIFMK